jgi:hypothetical protein
MLPCRRAVRLRKGTKDQLLLLGRNPDAGIMNGELQKAFTGPVHVQYFMVNPQGARSFVYDNGGIKRRQWAIGHPYFHDHFPLLSEFDRIADQIDENLPQAAGVSRHQFRGVTSEVAGQFESFLLSPMRQDLQRILEKVA